MNFLPSFLSTYALQHKMVRFLKNSEEWSEQQWKKYQIDQLQELLDHCEKHVLYYQKIFNKYDIKSKDIQSIEDLRRIPLLSKETVRSHIQELKANNASEKSFQMWKTSGTTAEPLEFFVERNVWFALHLSFNRVHMQKAGYKRSNRTVSILGINEKMKKHHLLNTLELSSKHLHQSFDEYMRILKKYDPSYVVSYPSAIYFLAKFFVDTNTEIPFDIKAVFCHGEPVYTWQRQVIENTFSCNLFDIYGNGEKNVLSATCEKSNLHHIFPNYCIVELIDSNGNPVCEEGKLGEIVTTGLLSPIFPFIRYKTEDLAVYTSKTCSCSRNYPVLKKIVGRFQDFVISKDDSIISSSNLNKIIADNGSGVSKWRFIQNKKGVLNLQLLFFKHNERSDSLIKKELARAIDQAFPNQFDISFSKMNVSDQERSRKHRFLIQRLPLEQYHNKILP